VVLARILMLKSGFEDEVLIKLIVGVVKHVTIVIVIVIGGAQICIGSRINICVVYDEEITSYEI
jgi:hypothetical protein